MDSSPIFRELRLVVTDKQDVDFAVGILNGTTTVSQVADLKGQETYCFDGDADIIILSYTDDHFSPSASAQNAARDTVGKIGDQVIHTYIAPALQQSNVPLELCIRFCNLCTESVILLADAIRENKSLVGFNISGNPGNDELGNVALKHACIETMAPIKWFQGEFLPDYLVEARQDMAWKWALDALQDESKSPKSKVAQLRKIQRMAPDAGVEVEELHSRLHKTPQKECKQSDCSTNEREKWAAEMREKLRANKNYSEQELETELANLELYELQLKIEKLIFSSERPEARASKKTSIPLVL